ncbi:hypothetical protein R4K54_00030 [Brachyspira murdochii]|uniref:SGNH/GDSL hydrolase family protein n=1 Tax=Brachyspira murdochii (strain ATCC 51284 / DSM 12563 / 56-150) TaxID=526224 RepID=D5U466_BRAM5|nr:hypothetical protein [Brachyspira murdochii]ADG72247.1 conserved hypothetical protein [Brachyspira murdochii DSM 12563]
MKIKAIKIICFVLIFCVLLHSVSRVLRFKYNDGIHQLDSFYKLENNSIDVLLLGSSHSFMNINSFYLYKLYGISSFNLAGSIQPLWNTYFYLKETLNTQEPKLIVLEAYLTLANYDYIDDSRIIKNNYGLKCSIDKINSIMVSSPKNRWYEFLNPFYQYHNRYSSLTFEDFLNYKGKEKYKYDKGCVISYSVYSNMKPKVIYITNEIALYPKVDKYYRMIIELAKNNNIPILIVKAPYSIYNENDQKKYNVAERIAKEYNIPFINFNLYYDDYNLDFSKDFADIVHLNYLGAEKVAKYLGKYLKDNYDLPDRRGDHKYYSWEMNAKYQDKEIYNFELKQSANLNEYLEKVKNSDDYVIGITMLGNYQNNDAVVQIISKNFNINNIYLQNASYVIDNNKVIYSSEGSNQYLFHKEMGSYTDLVVQNGQKLSINRVNYIKTQNGINMVIYDKFTEEIVDNIYLEYIDTAIDSTIKR